MAKYCFKKRYFVDVDYWNGDDNDYSFKDYESAKAKYDQITNVPYKCLSVEKYYSDDTNGHYEQYIETEYLESVKQEEKIA